MSSLTNDDIPGHVRERSPGNWTYVVDAPRGSDRKRNRRWISLEADNEHDACLEALDIYRKLHAGEMDNPDELRLATFLEQWLRSSDLRATTEATYRNHIRNHIQPALGTLQLGQITPYHVQQLVNDKLSDGGRADGREGGLARRTVKDIHAALRAALQHAVDIEILDRNPAQQVSVPAPEKDADIPPYIPPGRIPDYLEAAQRYRYYPLLVTALYTGLSQSELLGLRWSDISDGSIHVRQQYVRASDGEAYFSQVKSKHRRRAVPVTPFNHQVLDAWRQQQAAERDEFSDVYQGSDLLFTTKAGTPYSHRNVLRAHHHTLDLIDRPRVRFHALRHTHATVLLMKGENIKVIQERLGHSSIDVTMDKYSHVLPTMQDDLAANRIDSHMAGEVDSDNVVELPPKAR